MLPIIAPEDFSIIAHRGASAYAPENTIAAFKLAADMGITEVELDTQLSADGKVVLCHDTFLDRYGHGHQQVEALTSDRLLSLDMGSWFSPFLYEGEKMITLDDLFERFKNRFTYHIEIKGCADNLPTAINFLLDRWEMQDASVITSFSFESLSKIQKLNADLRLAWLVEDINHNILREARDINLFQLCPHVDRVTTEKVTSGRTVACEIRAWGLTGTTFEVIERIKHAIDVGCDGITLNWPDWVITYRK